MVSGENSPAEEMGVNCSGNRNENEACWLGEKSLTWGSGNSKEKGLDEFRASGLVLQASIHPQIIIDQSVRLALC